MRTHGTLIKWNDDRGFGFVALPQTHEEVFVHISAFPRDGVRPRIGEVISFDVRTTPDGRKRAEVVQRPGAAKTRGKREALVHARTRASAAALLSGAAIFALGVVGYNSYTAARRDVTLSVSPAADATAGQTFTCDGRTHCSQMTSCAEAEYFLKHCPGTQMDGDGDGAPCERQWCN
ncbi:MAG: excalibur calcium-binding domain-containing protein [Deltaproteobacteria bacterium]